MTKTPLVATETQISIVGHVTLHELRRNLEETEIANGFANRFLWVLSRRSKYLPFGGNLSPGDLNSIVADLQQATLHAREAYELRRDADANARWGEIYRDLSDGQPGMLGCVTSRAEAQVMRLACLYALLDRSKRIGLPHLEAALAFWNYCFESAKYIFGSRTGDKFADKIYVALESTADGLSRTQIRDVFGRNAKAYEIENGLKTLIELGRADVHTHKTEGRPVQIFRARRYDKND